MKMRLGVMAMAALMLLGISVAWSEEIPVASSFIKPTDTFVPSPISEFGDEWVEKCSDGFWKLHCGVDVDLHQPGKKVKAAADGIVRYAGLFDQSGKWGSCVILEHQVSGAGRVTTLYGHIVIGGGVKVGRTVSRGTVLGTIDPAISPPHCHFGVRVSPYDSLSIRGALYACHNPQHQPKFPEEWVDPVKFLADHTSKEVVAQLASYDDWRPQAVTREGSLEDVFSGAGKQIAFVSNRSGSNVLYTYETKTRMLTKISDLVGFRNSYAFSEGGNRVLLVRNDGVIVVLAIEAKIGKVSASALDIKSGGTLFPTWISGESFFFENSQCQIMQAELELEQPADMAEQADRLDARLGDLLRTVRRVGLVKDQEPRLVAKVSKPEATQFLSVKSDSNGFDQICIIGQSGKVLSWLTSGRFSSTLPVIGRMGLISPVGVNGPLAFCSNRSGNWDIYRAELGQRGLSEVKRLTAAKANEVQPAWAFNADKIYYTSDADGHQQIYVMDADGRNQHVVMP